MRAEVRVLVSFLLFTALLSGCAKESIDSVSTYSSSTYSSSINAEDTILANVFNAVEGSYVYYYGSTDGIGNAQQVRSVSFNRQGSDTVYNFLLDENLRIEYMYSVISGVRDSKLQKLSYLTADSIHYALYEYDWDTQEDSLLYMAVVANADGNYTAQTLYGKTEATAMLPELSAIGSAFNVGGGVLTAVAVGVAGIAFFSAPAWIAAAGSIAIATAWFGASANASTNLEPGTVAPPSPSAGLNPNPSGTPVNPSPCSGVNIVFNASMDLAGSILIANPLNVSGYQYSLNGSPFQIDQVFYGPYTPGNYAVSIKTAQGCIKTAVRYITNTIPPLVWVSQPIAYPESNPGACDAKLWWSYTGGVGPYTLYLSEIGDIGQQMQPAEGITMNGFCITAGVHTVTVTDSKIPPNVITADVVF
jgi:hypothetical protein